MQTDNLKIYKVFSGGGDVHYVLPHFQREYTWSKDNWETFLNDAFAIYDEYQPEKVPEHFLGSVVVIEDGVKHGVIPVFKLVDGQQRLITISLLLCALQRLIKDTNPVLSKRIQKMLLNDTEDKAVSYKLLPTNKYGDRQAYMDIIAAGNSTNESSNIPKAYDYLSRELGRKFATNEMEDERFFIALVNCFQLVFINLNQKESPYKIFESLNAKGKPLTQADLVRNYIAMRLPESRQEEVFTNSWSKIEELLQEKRTVGKSRLGELTAFLRHYLAMRSGILCNEEHIYARFRDRMEQDFTTNAQFIDEISTLRRFAEYYDKLLRPEGDIHQQLLERLKVMEISTAYPFLLAAYEAHHLGTLSNSKLKDLLEVMENYIVRRYICGEPTNYLNKMFPALWKEVDVIQLETSIRQALSSKIYPSDRSVQQAIVKNRFYNASGREKTILILESVERLLWKGTDAVVKLDGETTLEHIMPQSIDNMFEWQAELGENWQQIHQDNLHTLGNLTLITTSWNSGLSNSAFAGRQPYVAKNGRPGKKQALATHGFRLNSLYFPKVETWDEAAIQARDAYLTEKVLEIWPSFGSNVARTVLHRTPETLVIDDQSFTVNSWRDVVQKTAEYLVTKGKFEIIRASAPNYFEKDNPNKSWQREARLLSNGWRVHVSMSANAAAGLCKRLMNIAGLSESKWRVDTKEIA